MKNRKVIRMKGYDYCQAGLYFVTICTKNMEHYFGEIVDGTMKLNNVGQICSDELFLMIKKRKFVDLDEYVVMPSHVHLLLTIYGRRDDGLPHPYGNVVVNDVNVNVDHVHVKEDNASDCPYERICITKQSLGSIIGGWKSAVSRKCNKKGFYFKRQGRFHDHIIRDEKAYNNIKYYIKNNPESWNGDKYNK